MLLLEVPHQNQKSAEKSFIFGSTRITTYLSSEAQKKLGGKNRQSYVIEDMFRSRNKERNKKKEKELYKKSRNLYKKYTFNFFPSYIAGEKIICPP